MFWAVCMDLLALSKAAEIAVVGTAVFALTAAAWQRLRQAIGGASEFPGGILNEAAQRFRDRLERIGRTQSLYSYSALVFVLLFAAGYWLEPLQIHGDLPRWLTWALLGLMAALVLYALYRIAAVAVTLKRLRFQRDARIAIGHGLQQLCANQNRVFHDVGCASGIVDHVVVGLHGVYAVFVSARAPRKDRRVRLNDDQIAFAPGNMIISLAECGKKSAQLAREFSEHTSHEIRVRPVVAVPGWEVDAQSSSEYLVVNERNLTMIRGWKDAGDYLMNEDVASIQSLLALRCARFAGQVSPPG